MVPSGNNRTPATHYFLLTALVLLVIGLAFGFIGGLQYVIQGFFKSGLSFDQVRPLHVTSVVFWIILGATGCVLTFVQEHTGRRLYSDKLLLVQWALFLMSILAILLSYILGIFGGREYWEYHPALALPIVIGWILFLINLLRSIGSWKHQPVYVWMWLTGGFFFLFTYLESYLWLIPYFRNHIVNDMTIQWKSYGSIVGSWNMLIYGSSMFLMTRIGGNTAMAHSKMAFALYFTGLFNLMFNWGHHIYTLPTAAYIKHISYAVSMTELFILGRIIWQWRASVNEARKHLHLPAYRFLASADVWVFLTLLLAIGMSVPAINVYTHGTHITVAHTMGATIGINTFLLLAMITDILLSKEGQGFQLSRWFQSGYWMVNLALPVFWISLITAGVIKAAWQMSDQKVPFSTMMIQLKPVFIVFAIAGAGLMLGFWLIAFQLIHKGWRKTS